MAYAATWPGGIQSATSYLRPIPEGPVKVSVIIPALNEAENLPHVLPRIPAWVDEVILVDGHSTDDTVEVARQVRATIRIVVQQGRGKGAALRTGVAAATGDIVVLLDADGSTDPAEIPAFVGALLAGADLAKGSRFMQGAGTADMSWFRRLGNLGFVWLVRLLFGGQYSDLCYGYNACWMHAVPSLNLDGDGFEIETLINVRALRAGLKITEVASFEAPRIHGESRLRTIPDGWRVLKAICREWRDDLRLRLFPKQADEQPGAETTALVVDSGMVVQPDFSGRHSSLALKSDDGPTHHPEPMPAIYLAKADEAVVQSAGVTSQRAAGQPGVDRVLAE